MLPGNMERCTLKKHVDSPVSGVSKALLPPEFQGTVVQCWLFTSAVTVHSASYIRVFGCEVLEGERRGLAALTLDENTSSLK